MNTEQAMEIISTLANKLGTTAEHVYTVLLSQVFLQGIYYSISAAVFFYFSFLAGKFVKAPRKKEYHDDEEVVVGFLILAATGILGMCLTFGAISCFANPEYKAIDRVIEMVK